MDALTASRVSIDDLPGVSRLMCIRLLLQLLLLLLLMFLEDDCLLLLILYVLGNGDIVLVARVPTDVLVVSELFGRWGVALALPLHAAIVSTSVGPPERLFSIIVTGH